MTPSDLASVGTLVSGLALVGALAYVTVRMRIVSWGGEALARSGGAPGETSGPRHDFRLSRIVERSLKGSLKDEADFAVFYEFATTLFGNYQDNYLQFENGQLDGEKWASGVSTLKGLLANPAYRAAWRAERVSTGPSFRRFVDSLMYEAEREPLRAPPPDFARYLAQEYAQAKRTGGRSVSVPRRLTSPKRLFH
jgi:hypothetical protein